MKALLAEFETVDAALKTGRQARRDGYPVLDALTPYPVPGLTELVGTPHPPMRWPMAFGGFGMAAAAFAFEWWTAVHAYPFNTGGRPLFSWQVFVLVPFEVGILAAGITGLVAFLFGCGLPRLSHPVFDAPGTGRATQDRFFLLIDTLDDDRAPRLRGLLLDAGASAVSETAT